MNLIVNMGMTPGVTVIAKGLTEAEAKSIARGMNKRSHWSDIYTAERYER